MSEQRNAGNTPYGWWLRGGKLTENVEEQQVIALILRLRNDGKTYEEIAAALSAEGVTPIRPNSSRWHGKTVRQIVRRADPELAGERS